MSGLESLNQNLIAVPADHPFPGVAKWAAVLHAFAGFLRSLQLAGDGTGRGCA